MRAIARRVFLILGGTAAASLAAATALLSRRENRQWARDVARQLAAQPELDPKAPRGALDGGEADTIAALAEIVAPPDAPPAALTLLRQHVERNAAEVAGMLAVYGASARLLDRSAEERHAARFAALTPARRDEVLNSLLWSYDARSAVRRTIESLSVSAEVAALRRFVIADLAQAFYASPFGWQVVGYTHYPGVPARDPRDYTRPLPPLV